METATAYHVPNGPKNLHALFPDIDWKQITDYYVQVFDAVNTLVLTSTISRPESTCEYLRIHFVNSLGAVDTVNFESFQEAHQSKSTSWQQSLRSGFRKSEGGMRRFDIDANDSYKVTTTLYNEIDMPWLKELLDSPLAWLEWAGTQGQPDDYLPILINDSKADTRKEDERYVYEFSLEFSMSNPDQTVRT